MGPTISLLHETDHVDDCMSGVHLCEGNTAASVSLVDSPEERTVADVNSHTADAHSWSRAEGALCQPCPI